MPINAKAKREVEEKKKKAAASSAGQATTTKRRTAFDTPNWRATSLSKQQSAKTSNIGKSFNYESTPMNQWTAPQYAAYGRNTGDSTAFDHLSAATDTRGSQFWNPYRAGRSTLPSAVGEFFKKNFNYDGPFDQQFLNDFAFLANNVDYTNTNAIKTPTKKSSVEEWGGYYHNLVAKNMQENLDVNTQFGDYRAALAQQADDFKKLHGRDPSYDEFIGAVDRSKYSKLAAIDDTFNNFEKTVMVLPTGTFYSPDILPGLYNAWLNGDDISNDRDYFEDATSYFQNPASSSPSVRKYDWSGADLSALAPEDRQVYARQLAADGNFEEAAAFNYALWSADKQANGVEVKPTILQQTVGYYKDDAWFEEAEKRIGDEYDNRLNYDGTMDSKYGRDSASDMDKACYELYQAKKTREATDAVEAEFNNVKDQIVNLFNASSEFYTSDDFETFKQDCYDYLELDKNHILSNYFKNFNDSDKYCRQMPINMDMIDVCIKRVWDGKDISKNVDYTAFSEDEYEAPFRHAQPVATPVFYGEDQRQKIQAYYANKSFSEKQVSDAVLALSESGVPASSDELPVASESYLMPDEYEAKTSPADGYFKSPDAASGQFMLGGTLARMWYDFRIEENQRKLRGEITPEAVAAIDPVFKQLDYENMPDNLNTGDVANIVRSFAMADIRDEEPTLATGIIGNVIPGAHYLPEALNSARYNEGELDQDLDARTFNLGAYRAVYNDRIEAGLSEEDAVDVAVFAATAINGAVGKIAEAYTDDADLTEAAEKLVADISSEEGAKDTYEIMKALHDDLRQQRFDDFLHKSGYEDFDDFYAAIVLGTSSAASPAFQAITNDFLHDVTSGKIQAADVYDGIDPNRISRVKLDGDTVVDRETYEMAKEQGKQVLDSLGDFYTPGDQFDNLPDELREIIDDDSLIELVSAMPDDPFAGDDEYSDISSRDRALFTLRQKAIQALLDPDSVYGTNLFMHGVTDFTGELEDIASDYTPEQIEANKKNAEISTARWLWESGKANIGTYLSAVVGVDMHDYTKLYRLFVNNGKMFSNSEVVAAFSALQAGTATYNDIERLVRNRTENLASEYVNGINNSSEIDASLQRMRTNIGNFTNQLEMPDTEGLIEKLKSADGIGPLLEQYPEAFGNIDMARLDNLVSDHSLGAMSDDIFEARIAELFSLDTSEKTRHFTPTQIDAMSSLVDFTEALGPTAIFLLGLENKDIKEITNGAIDLDGAGFKGVKPSIVLSFMDPSWLRPYNLNPGDNDAIYTTFAGISGGLGAILSIPSAAARYVGVGYNMVRNKDYDPKSYTGLGATAYNLFQNLDSVMQEHEANVSTAGEAFMRRAVTEVTRNLVSSAIGGSLAEVYTGAATSMIPSVGYISDGIGTAAAFTNTVENTARMIGRSAFASGVFFRAVNEQLDQGSGFIKSTLKGAASTAIELLTEDLGLEKAATVKINGVDLADHVMNSVGGLSGMGLYWATTTSKNVVSEILEEESSEILGRLVDLTDYLLSGKSYNEAVTEASKGLGSALSETALQTAVSTLLFGALDLGGLTYSLMSNSITSGTKITAEELARAIEIDMYANLDDEDDFFDDIEDAVQSAKTDVDGRKAEASAERAEQARKDFNAGNISFAEASAAEQEAKRAAEAAKAKSTDVASPLEASEVSDDGTVVQSDTTENVEPSGTSSGNAPTRDFSAANDKIQASVQSGEYSPGDGQSYARAIPSIFEAAGTKEPRQNLGYTKYHDRGMALANFAEQYDERPQAILLGLNDACQNARQNGNVEEANNIARAVGVYTDMLEDEYGSEFEEAMRPIEEEAQEEEARIAAETTGEEEAAPSYPEEPKTIAEANAKIKAMDDAAVEASKRAMLDPSQENIAAFKDANSNLQAAMDEKKAIKEYLAAHPDQQEIPGETNQDTSAENAAETEASAAPEASQDGESSDSDNVVAVKPEPVYPTEGAKKVANFMAAAKPAMDSAIADKGGDIAAQKAIAKDTALKSKQDTIDKKALEIEADEQEVRNLAQQGERLNGQLRQIFRAAADEGIDPTVPSPQTSNAQMANQQEKAAVDTQRAALEKKVSDARAAMDKDQKVLDEEKQRIIDEAKEKAVDDLKKKQEEYKEKAAQMEIDKQRDVNREKAELRGDRVISGYSNDEYAANVGKIRTRTADAEKDYKRDLLSTAGSDITERYTDPKNYPNPVVEQRRDEEWREDAYNNRDEEAEDYQRRLLADYRAGVASQRGEDENRIPISKALYDKIARAMRQKLGMVDSGQVWSKIDKGDTAPVAQTEYNDQYQDKDSAVYSAATILNDDGTVTGGAATMIYEAATDTEAASKTIVPDSMEHVTENERYLVLKPRYQQEDNSTSRQRYYNLTKVHKNSALTGLQELEREKQRTERMYNIALEKYNEKARALSKANDWYDQGVERGEKATVRSAAVAVTKATAELKRESSRLSRYAMDMDAAAEKYNDAQKFIDGYEDPQNVKNRPKYFIIDKSKLGPLAGMNIEIAAFENASDALYVPSKLSGTDYLSLLEEAGYNREALEKLDPAELPIMYSQHLYNQEHARLSREALKGAMVKITGDDADVQLQQFVDANGGYSDDGTGGKQFASFTSRDQYDSNTIYYATEGALHQFLSPEEVKALGVRRTAAQYNAAVNGDIDEYAREQGLSDEDTKFLRRQLTVTPEATRDKKAFYRPASDATNDLGVREADRHNPDANGWIRDNNGNYDVGVAKDRLRNELLFILENIEKQAEKGKDAEEKFLRNNSVAVTFIDGYGNRTTRVYGKAYMDKDGEVSRWMPSFKDLMNMAEEVTCNFFASKEYGNQNSQVNFKLYPVSEKSTLPNYEEQSADNAQLRSEAELQGEIERFKKAVDMFAGADKATRYAFFNAYYNARLNYAMNQYAKFVKLASTADSMDKLAAYVGEVEAAQHEIDYWQRKQHDNDFNKPKANSSGRVQSDSPASQSTKVPVQQRSWTERLETAKERLEQLDRNSKKSDPNQRYSIDDTRFSDYEATVLRRMIPFLEQKAQEESNSSQNTEQAPAQSTGPVSAIPDQLGDMDSKTKIAVLNSLKNMGENVDEALSQAIADYHEDQTKDMSPEDKQVYYAALAQHARTHKDSYFIDPNTDYEAKLDQMIDDQLEAEKQQMAKRLKYIGKKAGTYKSRTAMDKIMSELDAMEKAGLDVSKTREAMQANLDSLNTKTNPVVEAAREEAVRTVAGEDKAFAMDLGLFGHDTNEQAAADIVDNMDGLDDLNDDNEPDAIIVDVDDETGAVTNREEYYSDRANSNDDSSNSPVSEPSSETSLEASPEEFPGKSDKNDVLGIDGNTTYLKKPDIESRIDSLDPNLASDVRNFLAKNLSELHRHGKDFVALNDYTASRDNFTKRAYNAYNVLLESAKDEKTAKIVKDIIRDYAQDLSDQFYHNHFGQNKTVSTNPNSSNSPTSDQSVGVDNLLNDMSKETEPRPMRTGFEHLIDAIGDNSGARVSGMTLNEAALVLARQQQLLGDLNDEIESVFDELSDAKERKKENLAIVKEMTPRAATFTDEERRAYNDASAEASRASSEIDTLTERKNDLVARRNELKRSNRLLATALSSNAKAQELINNKLALSPDLLSGDNKLGDYRAIRRSLKDKAKKFVASLTGNNPYGRETAYTDQQMYHAALAATNEAELRTDHLTAKSLSGALKERQRAVSYIELALAFLDLKRGRIDKGSFDELCTKTITEMLGRMKNFTSGDIADRGAARVKLEKSVSNWLDYINNSLLNGGNIDSVESLFNHQLKTLSANIEQVKKFTYDYFKLSNDDLKGSFDNRNGGHDPISLIRLGVGIVLNGIEKNKTKQFHPVSITFDNINRIIDNFIGGNEAAAFKARYIAPLLKTNGLIAREKAHTLANLPKFKSLEMRQTITEILDKGLSVNDIIKKHPEYSYDQAEQLFKAARLYRDLFEALIARLNVISARNGLPPVPKRKNYVPYIKKEESGILRAMGINTNVDQLSAGLLGETSNTKPAHPFSPFEKERESQTMEGFETDIDKIMDSYLDFTLAVLYKTDGLVRLNDIIDALGGFTKEDENSKPDSNGKKEQKYYRGALDYNDEFELTNKNYQTFVAALKTFRDMMANKKVGDVDRAAEKAFGRKFFGLAKAATGAQGAAKVGGNMRPVMLNSVPLLVTFSMMQKDTALALAQTLNRHTNDIRDDSDFAASRLADKGRPDNLYGKFLNILFMPMEKSDAFVTEVVWRAMFNNAMRKFNNVEQARQQADNFCLAVMADKSKGSKGKIYASSLGGLFAQFSQEGVNNLSFLTKDMMPYLGIDKKAGRNLNAGGAVKGLTAIILMMLGFRVINEVVGGNATPDLIGAYQNAKGNADEDAGFTDIASSTLTNLSQSLNPIENMTSGELFNAPVFSAFKNSIEGLFEGGTGGTEAIYKAIFNDDPESNVSYDWVEPLVDAVLEWAPGGTAAKRIKSTVQAGVKGYVENSTHENIKYGFGGEVLSPGEAEDVNEKELIPQLKMGNKLRTGPGGTIYDYISSGLFGTGASRGGRLYNLGYIHQLSKSQSKKAKDDIRSGISPSAAILAQRGGDKADDLTKQANSAERWGEDSRALRDEAKSARIDAGLPSDLSHFAAENADQYWMKKGIQMYQETGKVTYPTELTNIHKENRNGEIVTYLMADGKNYRITGEQEETLRAQYDRRSKQILMMNDDPEVVEKKLKALPNELKKTIINGGK